MKEKVEYNKVNFKIYPIYLFFLGLPWLICSDELIKLKIKKRKERSKSGKEMGSIMETRKGEMENVENSVDEEFLSSGEEK